jgi:hypothetical protein
MLAYSFHCLSDINADGKEPRSLLPHIFGTQMQSLTRSSPYVWLVCVQSLAATVFGTKTWRSPSSNIIGLHSATLLRSCFPSFFLPLSFRLTREEIADGRENPKGLAGNASRVCFHGSRSNGTNRDFSKVEKEFLLLYLRMILEGLVVFSLDKDRGHCLTKLFESLELSERRQDSGSHILASRFD